MKARKEEEEEVSGSLAKGATDTNYGRRTIT